MILQEGKRYRRRDGKITDPLEPTTDADASYIDKYPLSDPKHHEDYTLDGAVLFNWVDERDLIEGVCG